MNGAFRAAALGVGLLTIIAGWMLLDSESELAERFVAPRPAGESPLTEEERGVIRGEIRVELDARVSDESVSVESLRSERSAVSKPVPSVTTTTLVPSDALCPQWWVVAVGAGWPADPELLEVLDWIMWRESRCLDHVIGNGGYGLTQIQWSAHRDWISELGFERDELLNPAVNLAMARHLFLMVDDSSSYACGFSPWYMSEPGRSWCDVYEELS